MNYPIKSLCIKIIILFTIILFFIKLEKNKNFKGNLPEKTLNYPIFITNKKKTHRADNKYHLAQKLNTTINEQEHLLFIIEEDDKNLFKKLSDIEKTITQIKQIADQEKIQKLINYPTIQEIEQKVSAYKKFYWNKKI
ncbi:hypothetical protein GF322_00660 [Candidatus Dependentiae bacterium]|nr:hypothetical protein [Candidatus Dependentiae bacterium]